MRHPRKYLMDLPYEEIPVAQQWIPDGKEIKLTKGINLKRFGFLNEAIPNARRDELTGLVYPVGLDVELFWGEKGDTSCCRKKNGWLVISRRHIIPSQKWIDRKRVLELLGSPDLDPVKLTKVGQYYWIADGTHRIVARWLRGGLIRCKIAELGRVR